MHSVLYLFSVSLWRRANARNIRLCYPYWQYTVHFIFRFLSPDTQTGSLRRERNIIKLQYVGKYLNTKTYVFSFTFWAAIRIFFLSRKESFYPQNFILNFVKQIVSVWQQLIVYLLHKYNQFVWELGIILAWRFSIMLPASLHFHYFTFPRDILSQCFDSMTSLFLALKTSSLSYSHRCRSGLPSP